MDKTLIANINAVVKPWAFLKKGNAWYRSLDEVWQIIALERDFSWGSRYGLHFGVFVKGLDKSLSYPKERFSHIRAGVFKDDLNGNFFRYDVMDLKTPMDEKERYNLIAKKLTTTVETFFLATRDEVNIKNSYLDGYFADTLFHLELRQYLKLT